MKLLPKINLQKGDCLKLMRKIPDKKIDLILCDLPYGVTKAGWDSVIPFGYLWGAYKRIIKDHGAILLTGVEPFSTMIRLSNLKMYRYDWIWLKTLPTQFLTAHKKPMSIHENISVFYKHLPTYNPQMTYGHSPYAHGSETRKADGTFFTHSIKGGPHVNNGSRYPVEVIKFSNNNSHRYHPTQKPVALLKYLIKTYTNKGDTVLDNTMGSGSTGVAAKALNRNFIGMEITDKYFDIAKKRIDNTKVEVK